MTTIELAKTEDIKDLADLLTILFSQDIEFVPDLEKQQRWLFTKKSDLQNPRWCLCGFLYNYSG